MEYRPPHVKKKRPKGVSIKQVAPDLGRYDSSATPLVGLLWGGNVWIKDTPTIRILTQNGCYGNAVANRHIVQSDIEKRAIDLEAASSGCDQVGVVDKTCIEGDSPPNKKLKKCDNEAMGTRSSLLRHLMLNMATYHSLLPSEGLYLSNMSCMIIKNDKGMALSIEDTRKKMAEWDVRFDVKYLIYEHFRRIGWVPKCGAKFGVDYLLYEPGGPMLHHSSLGVIIVEGSGDISGGLGDIGGGSSDIGGPGDNSEGSGDIRGSGIPGSSEHDVHTRDVLAQGTTRRLTWQDVLAADRVVEGNKKDLIICNVRTPNDGVPDCGSPTVKSIVCKRWLIDKDRLL